MCARGVGHRAEPSPVITGLAQAEAIAAPRTDKSRGATLFALLVLGILEVFSHHMQSEE